MKGAVNQKWLRNTASTYSHISRSHTKLFMSATIILKKNLFRQILKIFVIVNIFVFLDFCLHEKNVSNSYGIRKWYIIKLRYDDHGYNEITAITDKFEPGYFLVQYDWFTT